jgi:hypothetical protein
MMIRRDLTEARLYRVGFKPEKRIWITFEFFWTFPHFEIVESRTGKFI